MKTRFMLSFLFFLWVIASVSCSEDKKVLLPDPTLEVSEKALTFGYEEDRQEVVITTNQPKWFVIMNSEAKQWCTIFTNENKINVRVTTNAKEEVREAEVTIVVAGELSERIKISQEAAPPIPILDIDGETSFSFEEKTNVLSVITNQNDWSSSQDDESRSWCTLTENKADNTLSIHVDAYDGDERTVTVTVMAGSATPVVFQVLQEGKMAAENIGVDVPAFSGSFVYAVMSEGVKIAEICDEYVKEVSLTQRTTVAYPVVNGKVDLTKGFIATNGGMISWNKDGSYEYTGGSLSPTKKLFIAGSKIRGSGIAVKTATAEAETLKDVEGNTYKIVKTGVQYWMAENLKTETYNDGTSIFGWGGGDGVAGHIIYSDRFIEADKNARGCLYNFYSLPKLAPKGWHVPSQDEWNVLGTFVSGTTGILLKESGGWENAYPGMNATGFSAVPSGSCWQSGKCMGADSYGYGAWWSTTEDSSNKKNAFYGQADFSGKFSSSEGWEKGTGYAVRLIRD